MSTTSDMDFIEGSGNVFADLGLPDAGEALAKAELAHTISAAIAERHLIVSQAADLLGVDQLELSELLRGRLSGFSIDRLLQFLLALDHDVEIVIKLHAGSRGQVRVVAVS
jgi:predicted XRE-type DNA-binding protein